MRNCATRPSSRKTSLFQSEQGPLQFDSGSESANAHVAGQDPVAGGDQGPGVSGHDAAHGAGRAMSRQEALRRFRRGDLEHVLRERGVRLLSGGLDEVPMAYKNIGSVMAAQSDLVRIRATFVPRIVKMAQ